jgi:uncharacterized protein (TIGR03435 family)
MMLHKQHALLLMVVTRLAGAQTFDAASVKQSQTQAGRFAMTGGPGTGDPTRISYMNIPLRRVLLSAYDFRNFQITGPDWLNTLRFDITATVPEGATKEQFQTMLRNLLVTRFQMKVRRETRELSVYALLVGKGGLKIKAIAPAGSPQQEEQLATVKPADGRDGFPVVSLTSGLVVETKNGRSRVTAREVPLLNLADFLGGPAGRPVIDMSGATGKYSFELYFAPDGASDTDSPEPGIFAAVQEQLGLRLEARKAPVEILVIDQAEKVPTGN